jgi:hypothetical protein
MGWQVIKQPDGRLGIFSSVVDDWIYVDCTPEEAVQVFVDQAAEDTRRAVQRIVDFVVAGEPTKAYYQFAMSYKEACELARERGDEDGEPS